MRCLASAGAKGATSWVLWIGRRWWPYPPALARRLRLERSIFIDPPTHAERIWAIDLALRCRAVRAVVADGSGLTMADARRLQLAAASGSAVGLLVRPPWELRELSAAKTRWRVRSEPSSTTEPRWTVELLRCKGVRPAAEDARPFAVRYSHETGAVCLVPDVRHRPDAASQGIADVA